MRTATQRTRLGAIVASLAILAGGCTGGSDAPRSAPATTTTTTTAPTTTTTAPVVPNGGYAARGPYSVGVRQLLPNTQMVDVWYPVDPRIVTGLNLIIDPIDALPPAAQPVFEQLPEVFTDSYKTGALLAAPPAGGGPFPIVVFSHGFGGTRRDAFSHFAHLASWGFTVVVPEHRTRNLGAVMINEVNAEDSVERDLAQMRAAVGLVLQRSEGEEPFFDADREKIAIVGYSAGGESALAALDLEWVDAVVAQAPVAGSGVTNEKPTLILAGESDEIVPLADVQAIVDGIEGERRFAVLADAGHGSFSVDTCRRIWNEGGLTPALRSGMASLGTGLIDATDNGCSPGDVAPVSVAAAVNHLTVSHLADAFDLNDAAAAGMAEPPDGVAALIAGYDVARS